MLLTISTTHYPASDLSYLLHKHPAKVQQAEVTGGVAHIFYTTVSDERCTAALLLDIDPVALVRGNGNERGNEFTLDQYVNDRPYAASSLLSGAIAKVYSSALNGRCKDKPALVNVAMPFEVKIPALPVRGGEAVLKGLFEPLGYEVSCTRHLIDEQHPEWGDSRYFDLHLRHTVTLQALLSHLYILIPVCDNEKHYWVGKHEMEKLLEKGQGWLEQHPAREMIIVRYLKYQRSLANQALESLLKEEDNPDEATAQVESTEEADAIPPAVAAEKVRVHDQRLLTVKQVLLDTGAGSIADLGCGEGKLLKLLLEERQFTRILGMDVSYYVLSIAQDKLKLDRMPERQRERIQLIHGSLTYKDDRLKGYDAAALVEVIEHLDVPRLSALERTIFGHARPGVIVVTTPNAEYNVKFEKMQAGAMRHSDHRFEWTRQEFRNWGDRLTATYGYNVTYFPLGEEDPLVGAISQMAVFKNA
ncbi:3' terminal RNA ribose 2'-O-methyltransferase Hen1 [Chitinophaga pendula]|uniref:3' terminal RNA ribose 2'-O-methyltransferase Hen1 n=1 Tax=Chitinophaga TaxID=79328 RepID=UPI000BAE70BF|nr:MULTISPECIES: 3' terminal RNA ribose 2'-O-methyltransferase Hen1 [Chitinophaga]ASZ10191.1 3' terminal RNA ribose 2'-O-methyltransferase Hen1 [Chitinophaga sp. MD30]UCJ06853.1 3' terminal RNA ribose 2'-O-methyltransferase Hen1 [Chitinophaga pendula]